MQLTAIGLTMHLFVCILVLALLHWGYFASGWSLSIGKSFPHPPGQPNKGKLASVRKKA